MSRRHRVRAHLHLEADEYDRAIRRFIPGYEQMLVVTARAALEGDPVGVVDLGAGTGALSATLLEHSPTVEVQLLDVDPGMLEVARARLEPWAGRVRYVEGPFELAPSAQAVTASLALHHLPTQEARVEVLRTIHRALPPGGVFVNADVTMPADHGGRAAAYLEWAEHLVRSGITVPEAWRHFSEWSDEDTYLSVEEELEGLREAGFHARCHWQEGVVAILVARKGVS